MTWTSKEVRRSHSSHRSRWLMKGSPQNLSKVFRAVAAGLDDSELPVRVHAALTLTEMVAADETVKAAVSPQVGKVIQGLTQMH